ncbi:MAG TPA: AMP-binding protein [Streptosporangiaceae bacterium]
MNGNMAVISAELARSHGWHDRPAFHAPTVSGPASSGSASSGSAVHTHGEVHAAGAGAAAVLAAAGVHPGARVLIALPDSLHLVTAFLGTLRLGALAVFAGPWQSAAEHAGVAAEADPSVVVCPPGLADRFAPTRVVTPDGLAAGRAAAGVQEPAAVPPDAPAYVQYTSGTTGRPKGAVHRHSDPLAYRRAMAETALRMTPDDVVLSVSKACFPYGLGNSVLFPLLTGASAVLWPDRPNVPGLVEQARRHRPTLLFAAPACYARLVAEGDAAAFRSLRAAGSAGEPLPPPLADRVEAFLGCPLLDGLGMTETGHTFISNTVTRRRRGTIGVVLPPYEISVRTPRGEAAAGEQGVLHVRGPSVLLGYHRRPRRTAEVLGRDGWLRTGDLVHVDADGFVHHHGRVDDLEKVGGVTISPQPAELALGGHPAVAEVAVTVVNGEVRAFVVPQTGCPASAELAADLRDLVRSELDVPLTPRTVSFVPALPRAANGKLSRLQLRDRR